MNPTLLKGLLALLITGLLFYWSIGRFFKSTTLGSSLQLVGATGLVVVALTHILEALELFPWMLWGRTDSVGHYLDLGGGVLGLTLFPLGYLIHMRTVRGYKCVAPSNKPPTSGGRT